MKQIEELVDIYTDYLISTSNQATATQLSKVLDGSISHDKFTRMLKNGAFDAKYLWKRVKKILKEIKSEDGCLIVDDTIIEKPHTDENDIVCWHYDHTQGRSVKGFNLINLLYYSNDVSIPVGFEVVKKTELFIDKEGKQKRKAKKTKNEITRELLQNAIINRIPFRFVLMDETYIKYCV